MGAGEARDLPIAVKMRVFLTYSNVFEITNSVSAFIGSIWFFMRLLSTLSLKRFFLQRTG